MVTKCQVNFLSSSTQYNTTLTTRIHNFFLTCRQSLWKKVKNLFKIEIHPWVRHKKPLGPNWIFTSGMHKILVRGNQNGPLYHSAPPLWPRPEIQFRYPRLCSQQHPQPHKSSRQTYQLQGGSFKYSCIIKKINFN